MEKEGGPTGSGSAGLKVLETIKRHLVEIGDSSKNQTKTSREVCASLHDLTNTVCSIATKQNNPQLVSSTVELLVRSHSHIDRDVRLASAENLKRMIKILMNQYQYRLQQDLFHELKKNGACRSLCLALECFSLLYPRTRPQKCHSFSQNLLPILLRIVDRPEEAIHESLSEALVWIMPVMARFLSSPQVKSFITALLSHMAGSPASYRRMAATALSALCVHSKQPHPLVEWLLPKLIGMVTQGGATTVITQGVLLCLHHLVLHTPALSPSTPLVKQVYSLVISVLLYCDHNLMNTALEMMEQLLKMASSEFIFFLSTPLSPCSIAPSYWPVNVHDSSLLDDSLDASSLLDIPMDGYFATQEEDSSPVGGQSKSAKEQVSPGSVVGGGRSSSPTGSVDSWTPSVLLLNEGGFMTREGEAGEKRAPLHDLVEYICKQLLLHKRVSVQSAGLGCLAAAVNISPSCLPSLQPLAEFAVAEDPKLVGRTASVLAHLVSTELLTFSGQIAACREPLILKSCNLLGAIMGSDSPVILKAACEALRVCLPLLLSSSQPSLAIDLLNILLSLHSSSYWLLKVELLQTLAVVDYSILALMEPSIPLKVLNEVALSLLSDPDHRVRSAVADCLVQLVANIDLHSPPLLYAAQTHAQKSFGHLRTSLVQISLAGIGNVTTKMTPVTPSSLDHIVWRCYAMLGVSGDPHSQRGALEVLCKLSESYPPPTLSSLWGCSGSKCSLLEMILQLMRGSWLAWQVQTHNELLKLSTSLFIACALDSLHSAASDGVGLEEGTERVGVVRHFTTLFLHLMRILNLLSHVIEHRPLEGKESKAQTIKRQMETALRVAKSPGNRSSQSAQSPQSPTPSSNVTLGNISGQPNFTKLYDALKSAYTTYQVSISPSSTDRFSNFLLTVHSSIAAVLEVALTEEIGRHVEELISYLSVTLVVDTPGAFLCLQQLLNALFGMNIATQQTHLYSPYLSSLPYALDTTPSTTTTNKNLCTSILSQPLKQLELCLNAPPPASPISPTSEIELPPKRRLWIFRNRRSLVIKPTNSASSIRDYLVHFEPLVVETLKIFSTTSSITLQERCLFLMVQLLFLKVRYDLLDCNRVFLEAARRLVSLMESGSVAGGEQLVPHLFQFLVMLAQDSSRLVNIPEVMQKCDAVLASGQNVESFAIPALQPLVVYLFMTSSGKPSKDLLTQREVVLNMLIRLVEHPRVITLLTLVLESYHGTVHEWTNTSTKIFASFLPPAGRLQVALDTPSSLSSLHQLLAAMTPSSINLKGLFFALLKATSLVTIKQLGRWLALLSSTLKLMVTVFPERTVLSELAGLALVTPEIHLTGIKIQPYTWSEKRGLDTATSLAEFLINSVYIGVLALSRILHRGVGGTEAVEGGQLLLLVISDLLLLMQTLLNRGYENFSSSLSALSIPLHLTEVLLGEVWQYPLLTLHYTSLLVMCQSCVLPQHIELVSSSFALAGTQNGVLLLHCLLTLLPTSSLTKPLLTALVQKCSSDDELSLIKSVCMDEVVKDQLGSLLPSSLSSPVDCTKAINILSCFKDCLASSMCAEVVDKLCSHPVPAISQTANKMTAGLLQSSKSSSSSEDKTETGTTLSLSTDGVPLSINKASQLQVAVDACCRSNPPHSQSCAQLLLTLEEDQIMAVMTHEGFNLNILEECIVLGIDTIQSSKNVAKPLSASLNTVSLRRQPIPLVKCAVKRLIDHIDKQLKREESDLVNDDGNLCRALVWWLIAREELPLEVPLTDEENSAIIAYSCWSLQRAHGQEKIVLDLQSAIDCCTMLLHSTELVAMVSEQWVGVVTGVLVQLAETAFESVFEEAHESEKGLPLVQQQMCWLINTALFSPPPHFSLAQSLTSLILSLPRLSVFSQTALIPKSLSNIPGGVVTQRILDDALRDADIIKEYTQRLNTIGWVSRNQFEECWMQIMQVINTPPPPTEVMREEGTAYLASLCEGVRAATSLLLTACLRPQAGNPSWGAILHTHRNKDINFLSTPAGKRLSVHRSFVEAQLILRCGLRPDLSSHYQLPLMQGFLSPTHPPIFAHNLERPLGSTHIGPGQLSLNSLLPITLRNDHNPSSQFPGAVEVDTSSCIFTILELYQHFLSQPIDLPLLQHVLVSVVLLSDQFVLSNQFEWMLSTFLGLLDQPLSEDVVTLAVLVMGAIKAATVLRVKEGEVDKIAKLVETSLVEDAYIGTQDACLKGLLYAAEDMESAIVSKVGQFLSNYLLQQLHCFDRYTEFHITLVWSLAILLLQNHSVHLQDTLFSSNLLGAVQNILYHQHTSTQLFRVITLGLEQLLLSFSLTKSEHSSLTELAINSFVRSEHCKSLSSLSLLVTCMYTGEEAASSFSGLHDDVIGHSDSVIQSRESISHLLERLRQGFGVEVSFLAALLPGMIVDLLPRVDALNTVVTELISHQHSRPWLVASIMLKTFELLLLNELSSTPPALAPSVSDWVMLSLDSFVQQEPESYAVWCITCLLVAATSNHYLRAISPAILSSDTPNETQTFNILCAAASDFCRNNQEMAHEFAHKLRQSRYTSLHSIANLFSSDD